MSQSVEYVEVLPFGFLLPLLPKGLEAGASISDSETCPHAILIK